MEGLFGVPQAFVGGIESQGKGTLHVHLVVFLAGFPRDSAFNFSPNGKR